MPMLIESSHRNAIIPERAGLAFKSVIHPEVLMELCLTGQDGNSNGLDPHSICQWDDLQFPALRSLQLPL